MKSPPFLSALTLLFWAWQAGHWPAGIAGALVLESQRLLTTRWQLSFTDYRRAAMLSAAFVVGLFTVFGLTRGLTYAVIPAISWLPMATLPLLIAQLYGGRQNIEVEALLILKAPGKNRPAPGRRINLHWPYLALSLLAASAGNVRNISFYLGLCALVAWALWSIRPAAAAPVGLWLMTLGLAGLGGYAGANGLAALQVWLVQYSGDYFSGGNIDPYRSTTDIGAIGELKQVNKIMLRISGPAKDQGAFLLHRVSYDSFGSPTWFARKAAMKPLSPAAAGDQWQLNTSAAQAPTGKLARMNISDEFPRGAGVLSLPAGATTLTSPDIDTLSQNRFGVRKATGRSGAVSYSVDYRPGLIQESAPTGFDLKLPPADSPALKQLATQLQLSADNATAALQTVEQFFAGNFTYALYQPDRKFKGSPLVDFLLYNRFGHCEYFATATVMLLRAAGIPARYAVGYMAQEFSELEQVWLVRQRHAHTWARVWTGSTWVDLDTTPKSWIAIENAEASIWEPLVDLLSLIRFRFSQWRKLLAAGALSPWWGLPVLVLLPWLVWRLRKRGLKKAKPAPGGSTTTADLRQWPGNDSGYYRIERRLAATGRGRLADETPQDWQRRILRADPNLEALPNLDTIIAAHYNYRFNPRQLPADMHKVLTEGVTHWLEAFDQQLEERQQESVQPKV